MTEYIYNQTIIRFRQPIKEDGSLGAPELLSSWNSPIRGYAGQYVKKKDVQVTQKKIEVQEKKLGVIEQQKQERLQQVKQKEEHKSLLQTKIGETQYR